MLAHMFQAVEPHADIRADMHALTTAICKHIVLLERTRATLTKSPPPIRMKAPEQGVDLVERARPQTTLHKS